MKKLCLLTILLCFAGGLQAQSKKKTTAKKAAVAKPKSVVKSPAKPTMTAVYAPKEPIEVSPPINPEKWREGKTMQQLYDELHGSEKKPIDKAPAKAVAPADSKPIVAEATDTKAIAQNMNALKPARDGFSVGLRAGAGFVTLVNASMTNNSSYSTGFHAGLVFNIGISKVFSVQPEVLFAQNGVKSTGTIGMVVLTSKSTQNVVQVPLLLKATFGKRTKFYVEAGGFGNYALSVQNTISTSTGQTQQTTDSYTDSEGRFEFGALGGLGVSFPVGKNKFQIGGRFVRGLGNNASAGVDSYTQNILGTMAFLVPLGSR